MTVRKAARMKVTWVLVLSLALAGCSALTASSDWSWTIETCGSGISERPAGIVTNESSTATGTVFLTMVWMDEDGLVVADGIGQAPSLPPGGSARYTVLGRGGPSAVTCDITYVGEEYPRSG